MNKTVKKVFLLIGLLVLIFLAWNIVFSEGGILKTGYNALVAGVNGQYEKVAGKGKVLLPEWDSADNSKDDSEGGFTIDIK